MAQDIMTTNVVPTNYDAWNDIESSDRVIQGTLLKCIDGVWSVKGGAPAPKQLLALTTATVLQLWKEKEPVHTIIKRPGQPWPSLDDLNAEIPEEDWEVGLDGNPRPPWQRNFCVYLLDPDTGEEFTYANGTYGAIEAVDALRKAVCWQRGLRGDHVVPLVELANMPMKTKFGQKLRPHFRVIEWRQLDAGLTIVDETGKLPPPPDDGIPFNDELPADMA
jgi:hypothetical protein